MDAKHPYTGQTVGEMVQEMKDDYAKAEKILADSAENPPESLQGIRFWLGPCEALSK